MYITSAIAAGADFGFSLRDRVAARFLERAEKTIGTGSSQKLVQMNKSKCLSSGEVDRCLGCRRCKSMQHSTIQSTLEWQLQWHVHVGSKAETC